MFCWYRPPDRQRAGLETRSIVQSIINTRYGFYPYTCYKWDHQLMPVCTLKWPVTSHWTQILTLASFERRQSAICPPTCNERCTRVLHLLSLRSYACVLIALFCVVFHPARAVYNLHLRFVSNWTCNQRRPVECDKSSGEQQRLKFLTRT